MSRITYPDDLFDDPLADDPDDYEPGMDDAELEETPDDYEPGFDVEDLPPVPVQMPDFAEPVELAVPVQLSFL